jgi:DNA-binding NarL/FixJ family response regulator
MFNGKTQIVIADDQAVVRCGLRQLIERDSKFTVVAEAGTGDEAVREVLLHRPDIVLLNTHMPGLSSIAACRQIKKYMPECQVVFIGSALSEQHLFEAAQAGASDIYIKENPIRQLVNILHVVSQGKKTLDPSERMHDVDRVHTHFVEGRLQPFEELTPRELEVLGLLTCGLSNREIAAELGLSRGTVRNYLSIIYAKLGVGNRTEAAVFGANNNINEVLSTLDYAAA